MVCKKQEQCKLGKMCGWAEDEETLLTECVEFIERVPLTNEEWFCSLSTEEKVKALLNLHEKVRQRMRTDIGGENSFYKGDYYREWLKQPHTPTRSRK